MKVFGIDIIKGSVRSRTRRPRYALVRRESGKIVSESQVSLYRLLRQVASEEPDILAVDSLQEVAANQSALFEFIGALPPKTRLVQVTGGEKQESLQVVSGRFNIKFDKFDPFAEARAIAHVAELGAGFEVIAFENACDIVVSRHRSMGKGGWSQNRYVRKVHGAVRQKARDIEDTLNEAGLKYEKSEVKAFGGLGRVNFSVCAARNLVPVRSYRGLDVQVKVTGRRLDRIRFKPVERKQKYLIVGLDPGTTIGIAALDLDGQLVHLKSSRQMSMADVVEELYNIGKPLVIASDVSQMPASVEKIRRAFNAVAYSPREDRSQEEKVSVCSGFSYKNDHERDSLSAAIEAWRHYKNKFTSIAKRVPAGYNLDEVRAGVVRGLSIEQVLGGISAGVPTGAEEKPDEKSGEKPDEAVITPRDETVARLDGMIKSLRGYISDLQDESEKKDSEIRRLTGILMHERTKKAELLKTNTEIVRREAIIKSQKKRLRREERRSKKFIGQIKRLKKFADLQMGNEHIPVKVLESLTRDDIRFLDDDLGISAGDIIYVRKTSGWGRSAVDFFSTENIYVLIAGSTPDESLVSLFREKKIPLILSSEVKMDLRGRTGTLHRADLEEALSKWRSDQELYERQKREQMLESIVSEYRSEREVEVRRRE